MSNVIEINNLYKEYRLGLVGYGTLREDLQSWWAKVRGLEDPNSILFSSDESRGKKSSDHILALDDINFSVEAGERVGIIGKNGAGKTTLLKILSRIASPTKGTAKIKGRIASLIAVGTGFHGELTGRENIYLNGSIMGLRKFEIDERFDEIVDFSGVEQFIDTPVKRYSSGMYVRLGFAVAAHLDPDILIVDEVLAVGDVEFREKALGKMKDVSESQGRTVLFVSHNMDAIRRLCDRVIVLSRGQVAKDGKTDESIKLYLTDKELGNDHFFERHWPDIKDAPGGDIVRLQSVSTKNENGQIQDTFNVHESIIIEFVFHVLSDEYQIALSLGLSDDRGYDIFLSFDDYVHNEWGNQEPLKKGLYSSQCVIQGNLLNESIYHTYLDIFSPPMHPEANLQLRFGNVIAFVVKEESVHLGSSRGSYPFEWNNSIIRPKLKWSKTFIKESNL